jgi:hypothetical protein
MERGNPGRPRSMPGDLGQRRASAGHKILCFPRLARNSPGNTSRAHLNRVTNDALECWRRAKAPSPSPSSPGVGPRPTANGRGSSFRARPSRRGGTSTSISCVSESEQTKPLPGRDKRLNRVAGRSFTLPSARTPRFACHSRRTRHNRGVSCRPDRPRYNLEDLAATIANHHVADARKLHLDSLRARLLATVGTLDITYLLPTDRPRYQSRRSGFHNRK